MLKALRTVFFACFTAISSVGLCQEEMSINDLLSPQYLNFTNMNYTQKGKETNVLFQKCLTSYPKGIQQQACVADLLLKTAHYYDWAYLAFDGQDSDLETQLINKVIESTFPASTLIRPITSVLQLHYFYEQSCMYRFLNDTSADLALYSTGITAIFKYLIDVSTILNPKQKIPSAPMANLMNHTMCLIQYRASHLYVSTSIIKSKEYKKRAPLFPQQFRPTAPN